MQVVNIQEEVILPTQPNQDAAFVRRHCDSENPFPRIADPRRLTGERVQVVSYDRAIWKTKDDPCLSWRDAGHIRFGEPFNYDLALDDRALHIRTFYDFGLLQRRICEYGSIVRDRRRTLEFQVAVRV